MLKMCYFLLMDKTTRKQLDFASRSSMFTYANTAVIIPVSLVAITSEMGFSLTQAMLGLITRQPISPRDFFKRVKVFSSG